MSNPMANPSRCINQINDLILKMKSFAPNGRRLNSNSARSNGPSRRTSPELLNDSLDDQNPTVVNELKGEHINFNQDVGKVINMLRRIAIKNNIDGKVVNTNQDVKEYNSRGRKSGLAKRLAISNDIKGDKVDTKQDVREFNDALSDEKVLKKLLKDMRRPEQEDSIKLLLIKLRRLGVVNNISGSKVNTEQDIKEHNSDKKEDSIKILINQLRRIAVANNIKGNKVNTKQDIKEYNDEDSIQGLINQLRRIALQNTIKGDKVKTTQNIKEYNNDNPQDDEDYLKVIINKLRRIAVQNNIKGNKVNTKQDVREYNEEQDDAQEQDDLRSLDDPKGNPFASFLQGIQSKFLDLIKQGNMTQDSLDDENNQALNDESTDDENSDTDDDTSTNEDDEQESDDETDDESETDTDDEEQEQEQDEASAVDARRMTINNNVSEQTRRINLTNNIKGSHVKTSTTAQEFNNKVDGEKKPITNVVQQLPKSQSKSKPEHKGVMSISSKTASKPVKVIEPKVSVKPVQKPPQALVADGKITCKTKEGKQISPKELRKFLDLLAKLKAAKKLSEVAKSL